METMVATQELLVVPDGEYQQWFETKHFIEHECPACGRVVPKKPQIMRYIPEEDFGGTLVDKNPYAAMGWITLWPCPCGYASRGGATPEHIREWGTIYGGWHQI